MVLLLKLNLVFLGFVGALGIICILLDRLLLYLYDRPQGLIYDLSEYFYLLSLKAYTVAYFISLPLVTASGVLIAILSISYVLSITGEMSFVILAILGWLSLGGVWVLAVAVKKTTTGENDFIIATPATEPQLYKLSAEITGHFNVSSVREIHITPGAEIQIKEDIANLDDVFYGGSKTMEVGLSTLQFLTVNNLKVLFARQYAYYSDGENSAGVFIRRLNSRMRAMSDNLLGAGILLTFNPVAWLVLLGQGATLYITRGFNQVVELKADEEAAAFCGVYQLKNALTRYSVETELHKGIIPGDRIRRRAGQPMLENIYNFMKPDYSLQTNEMRTMIKRSLAETDKRGLSSSKNPIKLRLKRLPETAPDKIVEDKSALSCLTDWEKTETRMMDLINYG